MFQKFIKLIFEWAKSLFRWLVVCFPLSHWAEYWGWHIFEHPNNLLDVECFVSYFWAHPLSVNVKYSFLLDVRLKIKFNIWNASYSKMVVHAQILTHTLAHGFFVALRALTVRWIYDSPHSKRHSWEWTHWFTGSDKWSCYVENNFAHVSVESI